MTLNPELLENPQHPTYYIAQDKFGGIGSMFLHSVDGTWKRGGTNGTVIPASDVPHSIRVLAVTVGKPPVVAPTEIQVAVMESLASGQVTR